MNQVEAITLRAAVLPRATPLANVALVIAGAPAWWRWQRRFRSRLPFTPVPITGQTFAVVLVGASLGSLLGAASLLTYLLAGIVGAPVYADGGSGLDVLTSPTGGYLVGFVAAAALTGWLAQRRWDRLVSSALGAMLCGNVLIYLCGLPWLAHTLGTDTETTLEYGLYPFVVGDLLKLYLAALLLPGAWRIARHVRSAPRRPWGSNGA